MDHILRMKDKPKKKDIGMPLQILISIAALVFSYYMGLPLHILIPLGLFILLFILLKRNFYGKLNAFLSRKFSIISKQKPGVKRLIAIAVFILAYVLLKQIIFYGLKILGIDLRQRIIESINNSMLK